MWILTERNQFQEDTGNDWENRTESGYWVIGIGTIANLVSVLIPAFFVSLKKKILTFGDVYTGKTTWNLLNTPGGKKSKCVWSSKDEASTRALMAAEAGRRWAQRGHYALYFCTCLEVSRIKKKGTKMSIWQKLKNGNTHLTEGQEKEWFQRK